MGHSPVNPFLWTPPPLHTEDPGSDPPSSILLDPYGYLSCRVNGTTAEGFTRNGDSILVTFWAATPPRVSYFTVHCPDVRPSAFGRSLPKALYSEDDLVLLRIPIRLKDDHLHTDNYEYFVYQAGTVNNPPSLKELPIPSYVMFSDQELVLLRRRDQDIFYLAVLHRVMDLKYNGERFHLYLYNSETDTWSTTTMLAESLTNLNYSYPSIVLAMGGEFGSVAGSISGGASLSVTFSSPTLVFAILNYRCRWCTRRSRVTRCFPGTSLLLEITSSFLR
ncbi:unnamed protein product [Urochloa humidicola]